MKQLHCCSINNVANAINSDEIEIGFLKTNFIRGSLAVETHILLYNYGNVIMKKENALREKDSPYNGIVVRSSSMVQFFVKK